MTNGNVNLPHLKYDWSPLDRAFVFQRHVAETMNAGQLYQIYKPYVWCKSSDQFMEKQWSCIQICGQHARAADPTA
ncbi:hypothetical protein AALO_G00012940 [Alosa alosa]|uniref:Uncharacterized protein n=1 Tax=Alosa alosa TaxID=278164 RepID=A0AAV6HK44_9TELE|nr:hypothetical protein AALO_G00012940 [Alosa alosa]